MKKVMILFMILSSLALTAQNEIAGKLQSKKELRESFTTEQRAELLSKKMTLNLNLTDIQQKKAKQLFLGLEKSKPISSNNKKELTPEAKYNLKNTQLDRRIAMKREFKEILSQEQFEKWEKNHSENCSRDKKSSRRYKVERQ